MKKLILLLVTISLATHTWAQTAGDNFAVLAREQQTKMVAAYEKHNPETYKREFAIIRREYARLSAEDKKKYKKEIHNGWYDLACTYAVMKKKEAAMDVLERSGYYDYNHMIEDPDLLSIAAEPRFLAYLRHARCCENSYLDVLRDAPVYNYREEKDLPLFTYQSADHPKLKLLRKTYKLDAVAGKGTDVSRMINLMRWVHNAARHDGGKGNPDTKNALYMLSVCKKNGKTLNCRGLALLLNEVYLSMGIPSRIVTCLPKDPDDNDCHVINAVWSPSLRKWVWMDPTFMAYVMNEQNELLSIEEVRERLICGKPLILNPDANWNGNTIQTKQDYLENYMTKNLYKLECPTSSEYNYETMEKGKERTYVTLLGGTSHQKPYTSVRRDGMNTIHKYATANPTTFWAAPPGQTKADFNHAMATFKKNYNKQDDAAIEASYSDSWHRMISREKIRVWPDGQCASFHKKYGTMRSWKYLGTTSDGVTIYRVTYDKTVSALGMFLDSHGKLETFRFMTSSTEITELMLKQCCY